MIQLQTFLKEIEAVDNSRPLVYIDINSNITLSPKHLLTVNPNIGIPESEFDDQDVDYISRGVNKGRYFTHILEV